MFRSKGGALSALSEEIVALAEAVVPSTAIVTGQTRDFGGGSGSAWLYDDRHLVTNNHVVEGLVAPVWVKFPACQEIRAEVVGRDALTDLAVLEVPRQTADALALRTRPARLGELCFALGSPLGTYPESMSFGIVSGLKRSLPTDSGRQIYDIIQTDCAINPGNSGGPLIGVAGDVLGVNTAGIRGAEGIGFAVPADTVASVIPELLKYGFITRASLGVSVAPQRPEEWRDGERLVVTAVRPTATGPFQQGDVLLALGTHDVRTRQDLFRILRREMVHGRVPVTVWRGDQQCSFECSPTEMNRPD
jgi:S1-C subfamily serine protease